jgi:autotransporter passenger strand-loop-strand repeat protein
VLSGGTANSATVKAGGVEIITNGGTEHGATVSSGGTFVAIGSAGFGGDTFRGGAVVEFGSGFKHALNVSANSSSVPVQFIVLSGGTLSGGEIARGNVVTVRSGGVASGLGVDSGASLIVSAGGTDIDATVSGGGKLIVSSGGVADPTIILAGGTEIVSAHGTDAGALISSGGKLFIQSGGTASDVTILSGGTAMNAAGATLNVLVSATDSGTLTNSGTVNVFDGGTLTLGAAAVTNAGSIRLQGTSAVSGATLLLAGNVKLSGGGTLSLSPGGNNVITDSGGTSTLTNLNNTISGAGTLGDLTLTLINSGTIVGNAGGLFLSNILSAVNAGTLEATTASGLVIHAEFVNSKTIEALGSGASVVLDNAVVSNTSTGVILASGSGARIFLDNGSDIFGGTVKTVGGGAELVMSASNLLSGVTIGASSFVEIASGGTQELIKVTIGAGATLEVASGGVGFLDFGTIGAGAIVDALNGSVMSLTGVIANSGTLEGTGSGRVIFNAPDTVTNAGTMKSTASGGLVIAVEELNNSKTIEALGSGATVRIQSGTFGVTHFLTFINNFGAGMIFASGSGAEIDLDDATINKGTVKAVGNNAKIVMSDSDSIIGATIAGGTLVDIVSGADVQLSGTIGSGALIEVTGSALLNLLSVANSGTILARASGSRIIVAPGAVVRGGAIVAQGSGSTAEIAHGAVVSGGTLLASGLGSLIEIVSGAVVSGGIAQIGNGIVEIAGSSGENVQFLSSGNGGLKIADAAGHTSAFSGRVSGFGGSGHLNPKQFIDLVSVMSAGVITSSYLSANAANTSGTLFISSGGTMVAAIKMVGSYSVGEFHITSGAGGTVAITDPTVPNGGSVEPGPAHNFPQGGVDLPNIAFGARTTLAYAENAAGTGGTLTVSDGRHAASIALLGNYIAGSFIIAADGHGGTLISEVQQTEQKPLLVHPPHG